MQKLMMQAALVATLATVSSMAIAQNANDPAATTVPVDTRAQDRGFDDWGLLGLLGLLGLVGRKRRDVTVDPRTAEQTR